MAEQLRLDIPWPPLASREVLIFAVMPGALERARLTALGRQISPARLHPPARFHVSLLGVGLDAGSRDEVIAAARDIGGAVAAAPFGVVLSRTCSFGNSLVLCCGDETAASMLQLQRVLLDAAAERRMSLRARGGYSPHLTLSYRAPRIDPTPLVDPIR